MVNFQFKALMLTFWSSWDPEYLAEMDFISPPKAEAHSFTLEKAKSKYIKLSESI